MAPLMCNKASCMLEALERLQEDTEDTDVLGRPVVISLSLKIHSLLIKFFLEAMNIKKCQ